MVYYQFNYDPGAKIGDVSEKVIGRRPTVVGLSGATIPLLEFDPPLNDSERTRFLNVLPPWLKDLFTIEDKEGSLNTESTV